MGSSLVKIVILDLFPFMVILSLPSSMSNTALSVIFCLYLGRPKVDQGENQDQGGQHCVVERLRNKHWETLIMRNKKNKQGCIFCLTCPHPELTKDHVLTSAHVKIFRTVTRNAINKSV